MKFRDIQKLLTQKIEEKKQKQQEKKDKKRIDKMDMAVGDVTPKELTLSQLPSGKWNHKVSAMRKQQPDETELPTFENQKKELETQLHEFKIARKEQYLKAMKNPHNSFSDSFSDFAIPSESEKLVDPNNDPEKPAASDKTKTFIERRKYTIEDQPELAPDNLEAFSTQAIVEAKSNSFEI